MSLASSLEGFLAGLLRVWIQGFSWLTGLPTCVGAYIHTVYRVVSPHCNVSLRVFAVRRARKYKEAIEDSANMYYKRVPDDADIQDEISKKICRLQRRRLWRKHKQQLLAKKRQSMVKAGQSTGSEFSSSSSMSDA